MSRNSKEKIKKFIKECNKGVIAARAQISKMDADEIIEMKAEINGKRVTYYDKWIILMSYLGVLVSVLGITNCYKSDSGDLNAIIKFVDGISIFIFIFIVGIVLIKTFWEQFKKGEALTALSYIDDLKQECNANKIQEERLDTYEKISKRQEEERVQLRKKWSEKQKFAQKQVELLDKSLKK